MLPSDAHIALLRLDEIGDFFLWLPYARGLLKAFPQNKFTLIGNALWMDAAQKYLPQCRFLPVRPREYLASRAYRKEVDSQLRREKFDAAVNPRICRYVKLDDRMQCACHAKRNFAWRYRKSQAYHWKIRLAQLLMNSLPGWSLAEYEENKHELYGNSLFLQFIAGDGAKPDYPVIPAASQQKPYFLVAPGAGFNGRQWPPERFAEVIRKIQQRRGDLKCLLCGSAADEKKAEIIQKALPENQVVSLCGKTTVQELTQIVAHAQFVISNDTGIIHIAALFRRPSFAVTGGGSSRFLPYPPGFDALLPPVCVSGAICCPNCNWQCDTAGVKPCILSVTVEQLCGALFLDSQDGERTRTIAAPFFRE